MKILDKTIINKKLPTLTNVLWLNPIDNQLMAFISGLWKPVAGGLGNSITTDNIEEILQESPTIKAKADDEDLEGLTPKIPVINHGTSDTIFTLPPNEFHIWGEVASLTLTLSTPEEDVYSEYMFEFVSGSTPTSLSISVPTSYPAIKWPEDWTPEANKIYQVSILNGIGLVVSVDNT